ncbi:MAG: hypothetical protein P8R54_27815 [Myxococcota bacterium]|nr:hypothetical protein [Myxococcota bacterium]
MAVDPLKSLGVWRGLELAFEGAIPYAVSGIAFWQLRKLFISPSVGKPLTTLELTVLLGALAVLISWAFSRQLFHLGRRTPVMISVIGTALGLGVVWIMAATVPGGFADSCEELTGSVVELTSFIATENVSSACQIGGVPGNPYAPGTLIRPMWDGYIPGLMWAFLAFSAAMASVGIRDRRMRPSRMVIKLYSMLSLAPTTGSKGAIGEKPKESRVQACSNATFWGEICGQLYSADRDFLPGEWCGRCQQTYHKADRELTFRVVTLFTDNIDVLNGLERTDTVSWDWGRPMDADARVSGVERWVLLGSVTVPDVLSVSQLLSLIHDQLGAWKGKEERTQIAVKIAQERASKLYGWIWFGRQTRRLTYARPTTKTIMAIGTTRLRDIITDSGEELYFQLDVGLLPLELRVAFMKTFMRREDEERAQNAIVQNSKLDLWVPVAPRLPKAAAGLWVPRVEGDAIRKWLSTDRLREPGKMEGVAVPLPYKTYERPPTQELDNPIFEDDDESYPDSEGADGAFDVPSPELEPVQAEVEYDDIEDEVAPPPNPPLPSPGTLDFVRAPLNDDATDPVVEGRNMAGLFLSEWDWMEPEQIQLLRQECLVLQERPRR